MGPWYGAEVDRQGGAFSGVGTGRAVDIALDMQVPWAHGESKAPCEAEADVVGGPAGRGQGGCRAGEDAGPLGRDRGGKGDGGKGRGTVQAANGGGGWQETVTELEEALRLTSICGLGQVALGPVLSVLRNFPAGEPVSAP